MESRTYRYPNPLLHCSILNFAFVGLQLIFIMGFLREATTAELEENNPAQRKTIDWAYSPADLMQLANLEDDLYQEFGQNTASVKSKSFFRNSVGSDGYDVIQRWIQDYKESSLKTIENMQYGLKDSRRITAISSHPFLSLRMMKRFSSLNDIMKSERYTDRPIKESDFFKKIKPLSLDVTLPNKTDVENIMKSILEFQFVYDVHPDDLFHGKFGEVDTKFGLSLEEAYEIGAYASRQHLFPEAMDWLFIVYKKLKNNLTDPGTQLTSDGVFNLILETAKKHDDLFDESSNNTNYDVYHRYTNKFMSGKDLLTLKDQETIKFQETKNTSLYPAYTLLCAGKDFSPEIKRAKLRCFNERKSDLAWLINPLKIEVLSWDPYLIQIHDAIGGRAMEFMRRASLETMDRSSTENHYADRSSIFASNATTTFRTSFAAELFENTEEDTLVLEPFERKVGRMTQLVVSNFGDYSRSVSEPLLISSYAFGGQFAPHLDTGDVREDIDGSTVGDRMATFMFYLNNVQLGGYTVFPELGISVVPKKGSALFWYDLYKNGTADPRTLHAGCPVILGQKWIATKWILLHANFQKRKCSTNALE